MNENYYKMMKRIASGPRWEKITLEEAQEFRFKEVKWFGMREIRKKKLIKSYSSKNYFLTSIWLEFGLVILKTYEALV